MSFTHLTDDGTLTADMPSDVAEYLGTGRPDLEHAARHLVQNMVQASINGFTYQCDHCPDLHQLGAVFPKELVHDTAWDITTRILDAAPGANGQALNLLIAGACTAASVALLRAAAWVHSG